MCIMRGHKKSPNPPCLICPLRGIKPPLPTPLLNSHQPTTFPSALQHGFQTRYACSTRSDIQKEGRHRAGCYPSANRPKCLQSWGSPRRHRVLHPSTPTLFVLSQLILIICISRHWRQTMRILEFWIIVRPHIAS